MKCANTKIKDSSRETYKNKTKTCKHFEKQIVDYLLSHSHALHLYHLAHRFSNKRTEVVNKKL